MNYFITGAMAVILAVTISVTLMGDKEVTQPNVAVGGAAGPDHYNHEYFHNGLFANKLTQGGGVLQFTATSTQSARTLTQAELANYSVIEIVSTSSPALTLTLPATSTMTTLLPKAGDSRAWFFTNKHASATTTTFAAGTGIILDEPDGQNVVIAGGNRAKIECFRDVTTDIVCSVDERIDAD